MPWSGTASACAAAGISTRYVHGALPVPCSTSSCRSPRQSEYGKLTSTPCSTVSISASPTYTSQSRHPIRFIGGSPGRTRDTSRSDVPYDSLIGRDGFEQLLQLLHRRHRSSLLV